MDSTRQRLARWLVGYATALVALVGFGGVAAGADVAPPPATLPPSSNPEVKRACELVAGREFTRAYAILNPHVQASPTDVTARACYASLLSGSGLHEQARQQMSVVLSWSPAYVEGYVIRAVSAAEMGAGRQARYDLELARQLDPHDRSGTIGSARQRVDAALATAPQESAAQLHADMLKGARDRLSMDQLVERALRLRRATNAERRLGDEVYAEARRALAWAVTARPRDPERLAALGRFVLDEIDVRGDSVEPTRYMIYYRQQDKVLKDAELQLARRLFNDALAVQPTHVPALVGLARMEIRTDLWANAERYLRRALATGTTDREVLKLMRDVIRAAAAQRVAAAMQLRMTSRWEERIGNTVYEYVARPTAAELARANNYDAQAANLFGIAQDYIRRALATLSNDAASHDFVGAMAFAAQDWAVAARAWEKAVKLDPDTRHYHYSLSNAYSRLNQVDAYMEQATIGRNLEHTTAATQLDWAWDLIAGGRLADARSYLDRAVVVDPADARTLAQRAVIAEAQNQRDEALALYRAAFALDEAHQIQRGGSWIRGTGPWFVGDTGHPVEVRSRIADLMSGQQPHEAAELYLQNVKVEARFPEAALKEHVHTAMLPLPNLAANRRQVAPTFGELMRTNRALAAVELARLGQCDRAVEHFRKLTEYDGRAQAGGAKAFQRPRDDVWKSHRVAAAAVKCFEQVGDSRQLYGWRGFLGRASPESESRRFSPTESGTYGKGGWRRP
jgi:tetratricopeptide (TPR) repeat protein